ncbi:MAG: hypothetical protein COZ11_14610, partial [Deltaproteobacteria bacterium CG_4_10_14_3_um_filter_51_14]
KSRRQEDFGLAYAGQKLLFPDGHYLVYLLSWIINFFTNGHALKGAQRSMKITPTPPSPVKGEE